MSGNLKMLKQALLNEYGSFSDKRIRNIDKGHLYIVDDRGQNDYDARGKLYPWFCSIFADVLDGQSVEVTLRGGVPQGSSIQNWSSQNPDASFDGECLRFIVNPSNLVQLNGLAKAVEKITTVPYSVPAYKYVCPRLSMALKRLEKTLRSYWIP